MKNDLANPWADYSWADQNYGALSTEEMLKKIALMPGPPPPPDIRTAPPSLSVARRWEARKAGWG